MLLLLGLIALAAPARAERVLTVLNRSEQAVAEIYVYGAQEEDRGRDRLGDADLAPGRAVRIRLGSGRACLFNVEVVYDDSSAEAREKVDVCRTPRIAFDGSRAIGKPDRSSRHVLLINRSSRAIEEVYVSPATMQDWGEDRLSSDTLRPGRQADIGFNGSCRADLRVVFANQSAEERRDIDMCAFPSIVIAPGWTTAAEIETEDRAAGAGQVSIINSTGRTVTELYLSQAGDGNEGPDLLGRDVLADGARMTVPYARGDACEVAVHVVLQGRNAPDRRLRADLCEKPEIMLR